MIYDVVIAGSGAGGSALAAQLAEGGASVLLLEKGRPAEAFPDAMEAIYRYYVQSGFLSSVGNCLLPIPTGHAVGGTTKINSGTCISTPPALLEKWEKNGKGIFRRGDFAQYLSKAKEQLHVEKAPENTASASTRLFLKGLEKLSVTGGTLLDRCVKECVGAGRCCFVCPSGAKLSADVAFLANLKSSPNFRLESSAELLHVMPPRSRHDIVRMTFSQGGLKSEVSAGTFILATGALTTPYFIRKFKLGPNWKQAGNNLSVHPAGKMFARFQKPIPGWNGVPQGAGAVDPNEPRIRYEGVYTPPEIAAITLPLEGKSLKRWMDKYNHVATFGFMIKDGSRGRIRYPLGRAMPSIRYVLSSDDRLLMLRAMRFLGRAFFAAGAVEVLLPFNRAGNAFTSPEELEQADLSEIPARSLQMMAFHPLGTAAMGTVVDENLRLSERMYVCDGSVVPESLGVNPQITIYAFALRLAHHLLRSRL